MTCVRCGGSTKGQNVLYEKSGQVHRHLPDCIASLKGRMAGDAEDARKISHPELELPVLPLSDDERIKVVAAAIRSAVDQRTRECWLCCVGAGTREQAANEMRDKWPEVFSPPSIAMIKNQKDSPITQNHLKDAAPELYEACRIALALAKARGEA